eukprot:15374048-Alexandrium_andersonii.AAC.1
MDVGALEPEPADADPDARELQAAFAAFQRVFRPVKGRGKGCKPATHEALGGPLCTGAAKGTGKGGGPFTG